MYHACLAQIFEPLRSGMTTPEVVKCPDGHFRRAVYGLGPYIADYPEQVWLAAIVQGRCPKCVLLLHSVVTELNLHGLRCDAKPDNLDAGNARLRNHKKTEFLINSWDPGTLWTDFGVHADIVVSFPMCTLPMALNQMYSHSQLGFPVLIFMNYYHRISSTR